MPDYMEEKIRGVCLQAIPYLGKGRILKLFTPEAGLLTLMSKKPSLAALSPFCIAECVYKKKQSEIYTLIDGSILDSLLGIRQSYSALTAAGAIAQDLLRSQLPNKAAPGLYALLCSYFKNLPQFENPAILSASFRLKYLLHEGLLALEDECARCAGQASVLMLGESVCRLHASLASFAFDKEEWHTIRQLAFSRQFSLLQQIDLSTSLHNAIGALFEERLKQ